MKKFTLEQAVELSGQLGVDYEKVDYDAERFLEGMHIELEHGLVDPNTNVTNDDALMTAKIVLAHLNENQTYYDENIGLEAWEHALDKFKGDTKGRKIQIV
jgi:hypothetical protein